MDAIQLIRRDHREVEQLFQEFDRARREEDVGRQRDVVRELVRELSVHAVAEEEFFYPALRRAGVEEEALEALEEHHVAKNLLAEIDGMRAGARLFAKMDVLAESVRRHVKEEEQQLLPRLRRSLDARQLRELGASLAQAKRAAPTRPHPAAPDSPPWNLIVGAFSAVVDRARDTVRDAAVLMSDMLVRTLRRGVSAAQQRAARAQQASREVADRAAASGRLALVEVRETAGAVENRGRRAANEARRGVREAGRGGRRAAGKARAAIRAITPETRPIVH
jgi:hemerythrin superfamily protein